MIYNSEKINISKDSYFWKLPHNLHLNTSKECFYWNIFYRVDGFSMDGVEELFCSRTPERKQPLNMQWNLSHKEHQSNNNHNSHVIFFILMRALSFALAFIYSYLNQLWKILAYASTYMKCKFDANLMFTKTHLPWNLKCVHCAEGYLKEGGEIF